MLGNPQGTVTDHRCYPTTAAGVNLATQQRAVAAEGACLAFFSTMAEQSATVASMANMNG